MSCSRDELKMREGCLLVLLARVYNQKEGHHPVNGGTMCQKLTNRQTDRHTNRQTDFSTNDSQTGYGCTVTMSKSSLHSEVDRILTPTTEVCGPAAYSYCYGLMSSREPAAVLSTVDATRRGEGGGGERGGAEGGGGAGGGGINLSSMMGGCSFPPCR